jgi:hypothetical protein
MRMGKRHFTVTIPIAGHLIVDVEAETEERAKEEAFNKATLDDIEDWEALNKFNQGNICYCPSPWEVEIVDEGEVEE